MSGSAITYSEIALREVQSTLAKMLIMIPVGAYVFNMRQRNHEPEPLKGMAFAASAATINGLIQTFFDCFLVKYANADRETLMKSRTIILLTACIGTGLLFDYLGFQVMVLKPSS